MLDEGEQDEMTFYVTEVCRDCGNLKSVCSDPLVPWYPQRSYCYATAAREQEWRQTRKVYKQPEPTDDAAHITDGLAWWVSTHDLTPDDDFYGVQSLVAGPGAPAADGEAND